MLLSKNRLIRRRAVVGLLLAASLTLLTLSFRQGSEGAVAAIQRATVAAGAPFADVAHRVTQPFVDAWSWTAGLVDARQENIRLQRALDRVGAVEIENARLRDQNTRLQQLANFRSRSTFPSVAATVIAQRQTVYASEVTLDVGSGDGVAVDDPVIAPVTRPSSGDGALIGRVRAVTPHQAAVVLILDRQFAATAKIVNGTARGLVAPSPGDLGVMNLENVPLSEPVRLGDIVVTAGWKGDGLQARLPPGIPVGRVSSVGNTDEAQTKTIQVTPFADLQDLNEVAVLEVSRAR